MVTALRAPSLCGVLCILTVPSIIPSNELCGMFLFWLTHTTTPSGTYDAVLDACGCVLYCVACQLMLTRMGGDVHTTCKGVSPPDVLLCLCVQGGLAGPHRQQVLGHLQIVCTPMLQHLSAASSMSPRRSAGHPVPPGRFGPKDLVSLFVLRPNQQSSGG